MGNNTELSHKKRTVLDLVRYIENRSPIHSGVGTPNFTLFLGAGASITSGIRSGRQLIEEWKNDIYNESGVDISQEEFFVNQGRDWYDESNPYASLFEHRFDLQRQRRLFVEKEVADKTPSIGYAYLVNLIERGYFNTIFTTNFDDLLNEAFYRFSFVRPIVCAHDSSISGVTITSSRPKIIKLHGDYLFDNIKATLRETESLEQNMRMKFQEFAKDYGLIVIGYSGQDRSIRDILTYLLQHDEYLKNGVYWCLKKGELENINSELKKLLWHDKVFVVEIDGFDELMAEINNCLLNGELPIKQELMTRRYQEKIIEELTENPNLKNSQSGILRDDCLKLKKGYKNERIKDLIQFSKNTKSEIRNVRKNRNRPILKSKLPLIEAKERKKIDELQEKYYVFDKPQEVLTELENMSLLTLPATQYKLELLELYVDIVKDINDSIVKTYYDELIKLQPTKQAYYIIASRRSESFEQKCAYLESATLVFENDYFVYNQYAELLLDKYEEFMSINEPLELFSKIELLLNKSIELRPEIGNDAYIMQIRYSKKKYANQLDIYERETQNIYGDICRLSDYHPNKLHAARLLNIDKNEMYVTSIEYYKKADNSILLEECIKQHLLSIPNNKFEKKIEIIEQYNMDYVPSSDFLWAASWELKRNEYFEDALTILKSLEPSPDLYIRKMQILSNIGDIDALNNYYNSILHSAKIDFSYYELVGEYDKALEIFLDRIYDDKIVQESQLITYSYLLLQLSQFEEVEKLLRKYYETPTTSSPAIIINYLFAKKNIKSHFDYKEKIKNKLLEARYMVLKNLEYVAAYAVLEDNANMFKYLKKLIEEDPEEKYNVKKWPIMASYLSNPTFISIIKAKPRASSINLKF